MINILSLKKTKRYTARDTYVSKHLTELFTVIEKQIKVYFWQEHISFSVAGARRPQYVTKLISIHLRFSYIAKRKEILVFLLKSGENTRTLLHSVK